MTGKEACTEKEPRFGQFVPDQSRPVMGMIEVTNRCNMSCPVCFANSGSTGRDVSFAEVRRYLEQLLVVTKTPVPIQISGGEPTVRKDLTEIISLARALGYRHIELVTNGIEIGENPALLPKLKRQGLTSVYLQFDGLRKETYLRIRGQDMTSVRRKAIGATRRSRLCCTLAVPVTRGVNDNEIGDIVRFGIDNIDTVRAINFQSAVPFRGRFKVDQEKGYSLQGLLGLIEAQTGLPADTFRSELLGHPLCNAMSYVFPINGKLYPLFKFISRADVAGFLGDNPREKILDLFAGKRAFFMRHLSNPNALKLIAQAARIFGQNPLNVIRRDHLLLFAKGFMEGRDLDPERVKHCCYGISSREGVFSFCAYNNLYRSTPGSLGIAVINRNKADRIEKCSHFASFK